MFKTYRDKSHSNSVRDDEGETRTSIQRKFQDPTTCWSSFVEDNEAHGLYGIPPRSLAEQITYNDLHLFRSLQNWELMSGSGPRIVKISEQFNRISFGVSTEILTIINLEVRQESLKWAVETMQELYQLNNYQSLMAFNATVSSSSISRLTKTFANLPENLKTFLQQISELASPGQNFAALRDHMDSLRSLETPIIPYLGLFQKDIIYVKEREPQNKQEEMILKLIADFQKYYAPPTYIEPNPFRQKFINSLWFSSDDDSLFEISRELEPGKNKSLTPNGATPSQSPQAAKRDKENTPKKKGKLDSAKDSDGVVIAENAKVREFIAEKHTQMSNWPHNVVSLLNRDILAEDESFRTVQLKAADADINIHLCVLSCRAPKLLHHLEQLNESKKSSKILSAVCQYAYYDFVDFHQFEIAQLFELWRLALDYEIRHLSELTYAYCCQMQNYKNALQFALASKEWNIDYIFKNSISLIHNHCEELDDQLAEYAEFSILILSIDTAVLPASPPNPLKSSLITDYASVTTFQDAQFVFVDSYGVSSTYHVNTVIFTTNSKYFASWYHEDKWKQSRRLNIPQSTIASLVELTALHGVYETMNLNIMTVLYMYAAGDIFQIVNWSFVNNFLIERIKSITADENKQIAEHIRTLTDTAILKRFQILFQSFPSIYSFDPSLTALVNQRVYDVNKISDYVKSAVEKENKEMREQIEALTNTVEQLKSQLAALQQEKRKKF